MNMLQKYTRAMSKNKFERLKKREKPKDKCPHIGNCLFDTQTRCVMEESR